VHAACTLLVAPEPEAGPAHDEAAPEECNRVPYHHDNHTLLRKVVQSAGSIVALHGSVGVCGVVTVNRRTCRVSKDIPLGKWDGRTHHCCEFMCCQKAHDVLRSFHEILHVGQRQA